jgi:hypothetical protein
MCRPNAVAFQAFSNIASQARFRVRGLDPCLTGFFRSRRDWIDCGSVDPALKRWAIVDQSMGSLWAKKPPESFKNILKKGEKKACQRFKSSINGTLRRQTGRFSRSKIF